MYQCVWFLGQKVMLKLIDYICNLKVRFFEFINFNLISYTSILIFSLGTCCILSAILAAFVRESCSNDDIHTTADQRNISLQTIGMKNGHANKIFDSAEWQEQYT